MKSLGIALFVALMTTVGTVSAYPTSAVFTPTAESKELGEVGALAWGSVQLNPSAAPGVNWFGAEVGLLPKWKYNQDLQFGGLEVGSDVILAGLSAKPVFNAKLSPLAEDQYFPAVGLGLMDVSPELPSLSLVYGSVSKTFGKYGHGTVGLGGRVGSVSQLQATFPFSGNRFLTMAAYESPTFFNRWGFVADWVGGSSELSSTYLGVTSIAAAGTVVSAGGFFSNARTTPSDGVFFSLSTVLDFRP